MLRGELNVLSKHPPFGLFIDSALGKTGRTSNIFRWYRSGWGRYTQSDRFISPRASEPNLFAYVNGNPLMRKDPWGLFQIHGSCDCPGGMVNVPKTISQACKFAKNPTCREIARRAQFVALDRAGLATPEPLDQCLQRRCSTEEMGRWPKIGCFDSPDDCGETTPSGNIWLYKGPSSCPNRPERGRDYGQTLFHEMVHTCGLSIHSEYFYDVVRVCTGVEH